ncbi:hypothetical protein ACWD4F_41340 [Streptomyces aureus]
MVLLYGPAANRILRRRSDGRVRPAITAACGVVSLAGTFLLVRALRHRNPVQGVLAIDFLPPRCSPEQQPVSTDYALADESGTLMP